MAKSLGEKHNNYLNVKNQPGNPWMDVGGKPSKSDGSGHAIFTDPTWGLHAGILNLPAYFFNEDQPRRTIAQILARWAPVTDTVGSLPGGPLNSPKKYALFVSGRMGIGPNDRLRIFDEDRSLSHLGELRSLFYAMAAYECGNDFKVPDKHFNAGVELLEPGILKNGTESTYELPPDNEDAAAAAGEWSMGDSVGAGGAGESHLFWWDDKSNRPERLDLPFEGFNPEGVIAVGTAQNSLLVLSDDGASDQFGTPCKELPPEHPTKHFRALWLRQSPDGSSNSTLV